MKAVEIKRVSHAELIELQIPEAGPGEVQVKIHSTGICGSDLAAYTGKHPYRIPPVVTGHEAAGTITALGGGTQELKVGDPVIIEPHFGCGQCTFCTSGDYNLCKTKQVLGTAQWPGSFAEYVVVPAACAYKLPPAIPMSVATLVEPLSVGLHAVRKAGVEPGASVAILGTGTIGLTLLLGVLQHKPGRVICTDLRRGNLDTALALGATHAVNPEETDLMLEVERVTEGLGVDVSFVAVPSAAVVGQSLRITRPKGRIVLIALFEEPSGVDLREIQLRERELIGTLMYTRRDYLDAIRLLPALEGSLVRLITNRIPLSQVPDMLERLTSSRDNEAIKVIVELIRES